MGCVFSFRMAPDVSFTSAADAPSAAGIPRWFCIYDAKVRKISELCKLFPIFFLKKYTKGTLPFVYSPPTVSKRLPCCPRKPFLLTKMAARCNQEGRRG